MSMPSDRDIQLLSSDSVFDYGRLVVSVRKQIQDEARIIQRLVVDAANNIIQVGLRLQVVHDCIGRRHFQDWLRSEFRWSQSIASNYMRAAAAFRDVECLDRFQPSALYVLARHKASGAARSEAIRRARAGEIITKASAELIVHQHASGNGHHKRAVVASIRTSLNRIQAHMRVLDPGELKQITQDVADLLTQLRAKTSLCPS